LVVRGFDNPSLADPPDAGRDLARLADELLLTDLVASERRLERLRKEQRKPPELPAAERCHAALEEGRPLRLVELAAEEERLLAGFGFLTRKPALVLVNTAESAAAAPIPPNVVALAEAQGAAVLTMSAKVEAEIAALDDPAEQRAFLEDLGLPPTPARDRFVQAAWRLLDTICFLTVGEDEVRAWEIRKGAPAVRAAGNVHSDIERCYIRAEENAYDDLIRLGSEQACKEAGRFRLEGKEYVVRDGDVMHYRFNV
jgi:ribosome-binding ATPase YchF (GTP1/OBG family)